jgi:hypothetical protein
MGTKYDKEDDYTLRATTTLPSGGSLTRLFNFASEQITSIYERKETMKDQFSNYGVGAGTSVSVALASQMEIQKFSELDNDAEVKLMRAKLVELKGNPPELADNMGKHRVQPAAPGGGLPGA